MVLRVVVPESVYPNRVVARPVQRRDHDDWTVELDADHVVKVETRLVAGSTDTADFHHRCADAASMVDRSRDEVEDTAADGRDHSGVGRPLHDSPIHAGVDRLSEGEESVLFRSDTSQCGEITGSHDVEGTMRARERSTERAPR